MMNKPQLKKFYQALSSLPAPVYDDGNGRVLFQGDSLQLLERLPPRFIDLLLTDPPYSSGASSAAIVRSRPALSIDEREPSRLTQSLPATLATNAALNAGRLHGRTRRTMQRDQVAR